MSKRFREGKSTRVAAAPLAVALVVTAILMGGCSGDFGPAPPQSAPANVGTDTTVATTSTTAPGAPQTVPAVSPVEDLTLERVRNARVTGMFDQTNMDFTLVDGSYEGLQGKDEPSPVRATISDVVAFGDLNGDGAKDAAVAVTISGETGATVHILALVSKVGAPASGGSHPLPAGTRVDGLSIAGDEIFIEATVPGPEDPAGAPAVPITATLRLPLVEDAGWPLLHTSQTSRTPGGDLREITITYPDEGASLSFVALIKGTISIAPFENNLVYAVYDAEMTELARGPLWVDAPGLGAPGTFELALGLIDLGCAGRTLVTISDLSAVDGSITAMDSIEVEVFTPG